MAKRFYTCIIVPDASQRLHKLRIPERALHALAVLGVLSFFVAVALGFSYAHMAFKASDYDQLQVMNRILGGGPYRRPVFGRRRSRLAQHLAVPQPAA